MTSPAQIVALLEGRGETVATAESLTGGLLCGRLVDVPGASQVVRGGVVAYAADLKVGLLGVDPQDIERLGTVDPEVAEQMARGVRERLASTYGVSTTGVAGPDASEGKPAGTVYLAVATPTRVVGARLWAPGDRRHVRESAIARALSLVADTVGEESRGRDC